MRKKLFIFFALMLVTNCLLANPTDSRKRIELKVKHKIDRRSALPPIPTAFVVERILEINLNSDISKATIVISNNATGEEIYNEEVVHKDRIIIELFSLTNCTEYSLCILVENNTIINGDFTIE